MHIRQSMIDIYRSLVRPAGGALALALLAACSHDEPTGNGKGAVLGTPFQGADGNLVAATGDSDWVNAPNLSAGIDLPSGPTDNSFGQGTKEDDAQVTVVAGTVPPNKNDLTRFYVASEVQGGDNFLYLAWERAVNTGNANLDFEINQQATAGFSSASSGPVTLNRTAGDLLITYDFSGSGTPTLGLNVWLTAAAGNTKSECFSANSLPCWGKHQTLDGTNSEGAVNTVSIQDPLSVPGAPNPPGTLGVGLFGEAAINLTKAAVFETGVCTSFGSGFVKSRSSTSFTAEVKDFIAPIAPLHISNCALTLDKSVDHQSPSPGDAITYTLAYENSGESTLTGIVIEDPLPLETTFVSVSSSPSITCDTPLVGSGGTVSCDVGTLAAGAKGTVTITVQLQAAFPTGDTTVTNVGTITSTELSPVSDDASSTVHVDPPPVAKTPALAIAKSVNQAAASPGDQLVYTLSYDNSGNGDATGVVITDSLPPNTTFVSASNGGTFANGTVTWNIGTVPAGGTGSVTFTVQLDAVFQSGTTTITNTAYLESNEIDGTQSNPVETKVVAGPAPSITKSVSDTTASPGQQLTYTLSYANGGNADASGVVITDPLPPESTFVGVTSSPTLYCTTPNVGSGGTVSCDVGTLAAGAKGTVTITVQLQAAFQIGTTTVSNTAAIGTTPSNTVTTTVTVDPPPPAPPPPVLTKCVDKPVAVPGEQLMYHLQFVNGGSTDLSGVIITDPLPPETRFVSVDAWPHTTCTTPPAGSCGAVVCDVGTLAPGEGGLVTITVDLDAAVACGTNITNTATIGCNETCPASSNGVATTINIDSAP